MECPILEGELYAEVIPFLGLVLVDYYVIASALDLNNNSLTGMVNTYSTEYRLEGRFENKYYSLEKEHSV